MKLPIKRRSDGVFTLEVRRRSLLTGGAGYRLATPRLHLYMVCGPVAKYEFGCTADEAEIRVSLTSRRGYVRCRLDYCTNFSCVDMEGREYNVSDEAAAAFRRVYREHFGKRRAPASFPFWMKMAPVLCSCIREPEQS